MNAFKPLFFSLLLLLTIACKESNDEPNNVRNTELDRANTEATKKNLNEREVGKKTGIGPIDHEVTLGHQIDEEMAQRGKTLFNNKCSGCHQIHDSGAGPGLGGVLQKRSPQWVMNMILNPGEMIEKSPEVQAMRSKYEIDMVNRHLTEEEAREVVEFLRRY